MAVKRRQHILPRCYLKHWFDPDTTGPGEVPMVWAISKDGQQREQKTSGDCLFWKEYFYDLVSKTGERSRGIEDLLSKIEDGYTRVVTQRIPTKQPLNPQEAEAMDYFVVCMFTRTESRKIGTDSWASARARIQREYAEAARQPVPDTTVFEKNAHAFALLHGIEFVPGFLKEMDHKVLTAPQGKFYVTSDDPCVWDAAFGPPGLANRLLTITLPLTPQHLLYLSRDGSGSAYGDALPDMVDTFDWRTIRECQKYFISSTKQTKPCWFENESEWALRQLRIMMKENP
jgi:hypothetical protein